MKQYDLFRLPSTMEDGGQKFHMGTYPTKKAAQQARDEHIQRSQGYYRKSSFEIK